MSVAAACSNGSAAGVQWQVNVIDGRGVFPAGVVVEVLNNDGVSKPVNATAIIDPAYTARVTVTSKEPFRSAVRWQWDGDTPLSVLGSSVELTLAPGEAAFIHFIT